MNFRFVFFALMCITLLKAQSFKDWKEQPNLNLDNRLNIYYIDPQSKNIETIFPVMLYSFNGWDEIKNDTDWAFLKYFGVNIVYSWDLENQTLFLEKANDSRTLVLLNSSSLNLKSSFFSFPDEPIGAGTATFEDLSAINQDIKKTALKFINVDVGPYYYRLQYEFKKNTNIFQSKFLCKWCAHGKGSSLSYDESVKFSDVVSFDYYPFRSNGLIEDDVSMYGKTSVGEFTRLLKRQYPKKSIWAVIQTMWFDPFYDEYKGNIINSRIIRNLTFDAIVNGADGISFFGHGQTKEYQQKKGYEFLISKDIEIWKATLLQTFELGELQQKYDQILLEDNIYNFVDKNKGYSYSIKRVMNENKYYFFVVNHYNRLNTVTLHLPDNLKKKSVQKLAKVGNFEIPKLKGYWEKEKIDFTQELQIICSDDGLINLKLDNYSVGVFSANIK